VPFLQIHGTADPILPYGGGPVRTNRRDGRDRGRVLGVDQWAHVLTAHNGAGGPAVSRVAPDVTVRTWRGPTPQSDVEFWRVEGGGHTWPGGLQYLPARIIGTTSASFDATATMAAFFRAHAL
jgi:polyhydroxybutyrate depolymerase